jgi:hypothetical protein
MEIMVISDEDYKALFAKGNFAVTKGKIILNKGVKLSSGGFLVDDDCVIDHSKERMDFLLSDRKERSSYMDFYGVDNHYFYGDSHDKGELLDTSDINILAECLKILD